ncbi:hypothetical protein BKA69DRAFT_1129754 [Paraphysoderma sedebokerense]|nr:hypothetical protein BKA69DRAFT_1129754 [Paraphysoderma sedebokerense]
MSLQNGISFLLLLSFFEPLLKRSDIGGDGNFRMNGLSKTIFQCIDSVTTQFNEEDGDGNFYRVIEGLRQTGYLDSIFSIHATYQQHLSTLRHCTLSSTLMIYPPFTRCPHCDKWLEARRSFVAVVTSLGTKLGVAFSGLCLNKDCNWDRFEFNWAIRKRSILDSNQQERIEELKVWYTGTEGNWKYSISDLWTKVTSPENGIEMFRPNYIKVGHRFYEWQFLQQVTSKYYFHKTSSTQIANEYNASFSEKLPDISLPNGTTKTFQSDLSYKSLQTSWQIYKMYSHYLFRNAAWVTPGGVLNMEALVASFVHSELSDARTPPHICDTYGCGGRDDNDVLWWMVCGDGVQDLTCAMCAFTTMIPDEEKRQYGDILVCTNQLPQGPQNAGRRFCEEHIELESRCGVYECQNRVRANHLSCANPECSALEERWRSSRLNRPSFIKRQLIKRLNQENPRGRREKKTCFQREYMDGWYFIVSPCGYVVYAGPIFKSEDAATIVGHFNRAFPDGTPHPSYVWLDKACQVWPYILNSARNREKWKHTGFIVDRFHKVTGHPSGDQWMKTFCDRYCSYLNPHYTGLRRVQNDGQVVDLGNSEAAEQTFSTLGCFKHVVQNLTMRNQTFFLHYMIEAHNNYLTRRLANSKNDKHPFPVYNPMIF